MTIDADLVNPVPDRRPLDPDLVRELVAAQFPQWAGLPVRPVRHQGWDNRTYRLGTNMLVRLPSAAGYAPAVEKEQHWLPRLAPHLPLPIPTVLARGEPGPGYPYPWSVYRWIDGEPATVGRIGDLVEFATDLTRFLVALQRVDASGGPGPGPHCFERGGPLSFYADDTWRAVETLDGLVPVDVVTEIWRAALRTTWDRPPVWFHGDIAHGNLLVRDGRLAAVIDFGTCGVGDPACDLAIAWTLFEGESRETFRAGLGVDPDTWARGRGWTLWKALIVYAEAHRNLAAGSSGPGADQARVREEAKVAESRRVLAQLFTEYAREAALSPDWGR